MKIKKNMILELKRDTWYYNNEIYSPNKSSQKNGGFIKNGEFLIVCDINKTKNEVLKIKALHSQHNIVEIVCAHGDEDYYFNEINSVQ